MSLLEIKNISKNFSSGDNTITALYETNFSIEENEFVAIVGPSGSGKSTLLTILGVLQTPTTGSMFVNDKMVSDLNQKQKTKFRYENIGFILQSSNLIPFLTVSEQFKLLDKINKKRDDEYYHELLNTLDISHLKAKAVNELSGGERQRVAIARALYNQPLLVLADEPTASLDSVRAFEVVELLAKETKNRKRATIMVTHDMRMTKLCDKVYIMEDGKLTLVPKE